MEAHDVGNNNVEARGSRHIHEQLPPGGHINTLVLQLIDGRGTEQCELNV